MAEPIPHVVKASGAAGAAPAGSIPISLYGATPPGPAQVAWGDVTGKPTTFAPTTGTGAAQAAPGNHNHTVVAHAPSNLPASANLQAAFEALSIRVRALETATP